jgi:hypothetical protein
MMEMCVREGGEECGLESADGVRLEWGAVWPAMCTEDREESV